MLLQISLGGLLLMVTTVVVAGSALAMLQFARRRVDWLSAEPYDQRLMLAAALASVWMLLVITASVAIWACAFRLLGLFSDIEVAVYFTLITFTTLGFGDVLAPPEWRIFAATASIGGLLNVALLTAVMIETLRNIRSAQARNFKRKNGSEP